MLYAENLEQTRVDQELQNDSISNINVVHEAKAWGKPVKPRKAFLGLAGILACGILPLMMVLALEQMNDSVRKPSDVERALDAPVMIQIPRANNYSRVYR